MFDETLDYRMISFRKMKLMYTVLGTKRINLETL